MPVKQKPFNSKLLDFSLSDFISKKSKKTTKKYTKSHTKSHTKSISNYESKLGLIIKSSKNNAFY